jgi:hypothetical protein
VDTGFRVTPQATPVSVLAPTSLELFGIGLPGLALTRRKRSN